MKVINQVGDNSRSQRHVYLTSTNKSRLYSNNHVHNAYKDEFIIGVLQSWSNSEAIRRLLDVSIIGGYYGYPPLTSSLEEFQTQFSADGVFKLLPMEGLKSELDHLQYREHKRVVIQGHVAAIKIVHRSKHTDSSVNAATQQLGDSQAQSKSDTTLVGGISSPVQTRASRKQEQTKYTVEKVLRNRRVKVMITAPKKRLQDGREMIDKKQKTASDQSDKDVEGSQDINESSTTFRPQQDLSYDVDPQWCVLEQKIPIIGSHHICQQTLPRIYSQKYSDVLQYSFGLQPSVVSNTMLKETLEDVPVSETLQDYYHVTLVGLNRTAAVNTVFIPDISMTSNRESLNTDKMSFLTLLTGTKTTERGISVESDPLRDTGPQTQQQQANKTGNAAVVHGRTAPNEGVEHDLDSLRGVRLVAVLDLYCCGDGQTEIILNRAYTV
ncbi:RPA-related protein RADX-like [Glandiceps talaboti]